MERKEGGVFQGRRRVRASGESRCQALKMAPGWEENWLKRRPENKGETGTRLGGPGLRAVPMGGKSLPPPRCYIPIFPVLRARGEELLRPGCAPVQELGLPGASAHREMGPSCQAQMLSS